MLNYKIFKIKQSISQKDFPSVKDRVVIFDLGNSVQLNSMFFGYCIINSDRVILMNPNKLANNLIKILGLEEILNVYDTEEEAIKKAKEIIEDGNN